MLDVDYRGFGPYSDLTTDALILLWILRFLQISAAIFAIFAVIFYRP